mgnify:CR=1 FL=1
MTTDYLAILRILLPEFLLVATALLVLGADLTLWRRLPTSFRKTLAALLTTLGGCAVGWALSRSHANTNLQEGLWVVSGPSIFLKRVLLGLTVGTAWLSREESFTRHVGEYFVLLLLSAVGLFALVSTEHLLVAFVALELLSLSLYTMTAFHKGSVRSVEAGLKYYLFGGIAAAALLYGISLLYGLSGEVLLTPMATKLGAQAPEPILYVALVLVAAGLGFKIAAVPFHLWAPDAYQGAPVSTAAFVASGSKVASFYLLGKLFMVGLTGAAGAAAWQAFQPGWIPVLALMAAGSMVIGNFAALAQQSLRRILAYSAIAQAGYILVGLSGNQPASTQAILYYVVTYAIASLGVFGIVAVLEKNGGADTLAHCAGLSRRSPYVAGCLAIFVLSFAGIPPLAGFFGKFYLFTAALKSATGSMGMLWLVLLALAMSCVALYYYLQVLKQAFVATGPDLHESLDITWMTRLLIGLCALAVILLGCFPNWLLSRFPLGQ